MSFTQIIERRLLMAESSLEDLGITVTFRASDGFQLWYVQINGVPSPQADYNNPIILQLPSSRLLAAVDLIKKKDMYLQLFSFFKGCYLRTQSRNVMFTKFPRKRNTLRRTQVFKTKPNSFWKSQELYFLESFLKGFHFCPKLLVNREASIYPKFKEATPQLNC